MVSSMMYALLMETLPVLTTLVVKMILLPSVHMSIASVSPGITGDANRPLAAAGCRGCPIMWRVSQ